MSVSTFQMQSPNFFTLAIVVLVQCERNQATLLEMVTLLNSFYFNKQRFPCMWILNYLTNFFITMHMDMEERRCCQENELQNGANCGALRFPGQIQLVLFILGQSHYLQNLRLKECHSSLEDVSVSAVIIPKNWGTISYDGRSQEEGIDAQFWGMMTALTDTSDPELLYSHC